MTSHLIMNGDVLSGLKTLKDSSVQCVVTSPPYSCQVVACNEEWGLRDYGVDGQIGLEKTPEEYVAKMVEVFREVRRILRDDGTLWLNLGDSYAHNGACGGGSPVGERKCRESDAQKQRSMDYGIPDGLKPKDMIGIPWRVAFALQADGWTLRSDIIWAKRNCMPESCRDRPTKSHEYIFLLTKKPRYYYDGDAIREKGNDKPHAPGWVNEVTTRNDRKPDNESNFREWGAVGTRNKRTVWWINPQPRPEAHFATFPDELAETCIKAGSRIDDTVLDPFMGSGTVAVIARDLNRSSIGIELNPEYVKIIKERLQAHSQLDTGVVEYRFEKVPA